MALISQRLWLPNPILRLSEMTPPRDAREARFSLAPKAAPRVCASWPSPVISK